MRHMLQRWLQPPKPCTLRYDHSPSSAAFHMVDPFGDHIGSSSVWTCGALICCCFVAGCCCIVDHSVVDFQNTIACTTQSMLSCCGKKLQTYPLHKRSWLCSRYCSLLLSLTSVDLPPDRLCVCRRQGFRKPTPQSFSTPAPPTLPRT